MSTGQLMEPDTRYALDALFLDRFLALARQAATREPPPARPGARLRSPVFVCGCPRSGTTLMGRCLGNHPDAIVAEESYFLCDLFMLHAAHFGGMNRDTWTPLRAYVDEAQLVDLAGAYADGLFTALLERHGASRFVDHTPWYGLILPFLNALYPDCRIVHMIRDGRDVVRSLTALARGGVVWAGRSMAERAQYWRDVVTQTRDLGHALGHARYIEVRYEALCSDPEHTLAETVQRLGWSWDPAVLAPLAMPVSAPTRLNVALADVDEAGQFRLHPRPPRPGDPPSEWDEDDRHTFDRYAGAAMHTLGYR